MWFRLRRLWLLIGLGLGFTARGAVPLPPPPDSLRAVVRAAATERAQALAALRVARAFIEEIDSAAVPWAEHAEELARRLADPVLEGEALDARGNFYRWSRDLTRAQPLLERATALLADGPAPARAANHYHLGMLYGDLHQFRRALRSYRLARGLFGERADATQRAEVLNSIGLVHLYAGRLDSATAAFLQAARAHHQLDNRQSEAAALGNLALALLQQERYGEAARYARQALALEQADGDSAAIGETYFYLGRIALKADSLALALRYARLSARVLQDHHEYGVALRAFHIMGEVWQRRGRYDSAVFYLRRVRAGYRQLHLASQELPLAAQLADYYGAAGRWPAARALADSVLRQTGADSSTTALDAALLALGVLRREAESRHDTERAYALLLRELALRDRRQRAENARTTTELRIAYEAEQAEEQLRLLQTQQEVARLRQQRERLLLGLGLVVTLVIGGWAVRRYRQRTRAREQRLRTQIAADLHDDVGALLTQISVQSELLRAGVYAPQEQEAHLDQISEASRTAVRQMSDVVWSVDARNDRLPDLVNRLRDYAAEVLPPTGLDSEFDVAADLPDVVLDALTRQNVYLIFKEALHNAVKHARGASVVRVQVRTSGHHLRLTITNDGPPAPPGRVTGHGLRNILMRAEAVGGTASCERLAGGGFVVAAEVPV